MSVLAFIALGSNLGDRRANLDRSLAALRARPGIMVQRVSSFYETRPVGGPEGQGSYLNAAAELTTEHPAETLLQILLEIEASLGRVRQERDGPRTIDLDLLLYGNLVCEQPHLTLPHPRMHQRLFVLQPLAEIAPGVRHPVLGRTVADLLANLLDVRLAGPGSRRELTGRRALVTGSTSGIGRAIALELAAAGADVIVHGRRSREAAQAVASEVGNRGNQSGIILADLGKATHLLPLVKKAWAVWGGLDIWINNAGADTLTGEARNWSFQRKLRRLLEVDVTATMLLARAAGQRMKVAGGGVILNMGWDQAETGMEGDSGELFAASKGAIMAFTRSLALSLAPEVRVNCLAPGWIRTAWGEKAPTSWQERVLRETPLRRWGLPEDVAGVARWLCSPEASYLTGQIVKIDGGAIR